MRRMLFRHSCYMTFFKPLAKYTINENNLTKETTISIKAHNLFFSTFFRQLSFRQEGKQITLEA